MQWLYSFLQNTIFNYATRTQIGLKSWNMVGNTLGKYLIKLPFWITGQIFFVSIFKCRIFEKLDNCLCWLNFFHMNCLFHYVWFNNQVVILLLVFKMHPFLNISNSISYSIFSLGAHGTAVFFIKYDIYRTKLVPYAQRLQFDRETLFSARYVIDQIQRTLSLKDIQGVLHE